MGNLTVCGKIWRGTSRHGCGSGFSGTNCIAIAPVGGAGGGPGDSQVGSGCQPSSGSEGDGMGSSSAGGGARTVAGVVLLDFGAEPVIRAVVEPDALSGGASDPTSMEHR